VISPDGHIEESTVVEYSVLMPGVVIGKNARVRRAIIEDGVYIPDGLQIGFDLDHDRRHYKVTGAGVVVVANTRGQLESPLVTERTVAFKTEQLSRRIRAARFVA
jgi:ADP-glucose pyrophosphorylase